MAESRCCGSAIFASPLPRGKVGHLGSSVLGITPAEKYLV
jgi:hypothetical protein